MKKYLLVLLCVGSSAVAMNAAPWVVTIEGRDKEWAVVHEQHQLSELYAKRKARRDWVKRTWNDLGECIGEKLQRRNSKSD